MKHRPPYPGHFGDIDRAREWLDEYVLWFNNGHHHSALAWRTPQSVADGTWIQINKA